jgi:hypothetical protein
MKLVKSDITSLLGLLGTASLACVTGGSGTIIAGLAPLLSGVGSSVSASLLMGFGSKMKHRLVDIHPNDMNHSIKKLFVRTVGDALENINILYAETSAASDEKKAAKRLIGKLRQKIEKDMPEAVHIKIDEPEVKRFLYERDGDGAEDGIVKFIINTFREAGASDSFGQFLSQHLAGQIQLCFGEGLKNPANHNAWVSFQRMLAEDLREQVNIIAQGQQDIKSELAGLRQGAQIQATALSPEELEGLCQLKEVLQNEKLFQVKFDQGFSDSLKAIEERENELIRTTTETNINVKELKVMVRRIEAKQRTVAIAIYAVLAMVVTVVGGLIFFWGHQPFTATVHLHGWAELHSKMEPQFIRSGSKITLSGIGEAEINQQGEVVFKNVPSTYNGKKVSITITATENYPFYLPADSILLNKEVSEVEVQIQGLDKLEGMVTNADGLGIVGATVLVAGISTVSDASGYFEIHIPFKQQQFSQEVRAAKEGYLPYFENDMPMAVENKFLNIVLKQP